MFTPNVGDSVAVTGAHCKALFPSLGEVMVLKDEEWRWDAGRERKLALTLFIDFQVLEGLDGCR